MMSGETAERVEASMAQYERVSITDCTFGGSARLVDGPALIEDLLAFRGDTAARDPSVSGITLDPLV